MRLSFIKKTALTVCIVALSSVLPVNIAHAETTYHLVETEDAMEYLFVGDSRTVGMMDAVKNDGNVAYICEVGKGFSWLEDKASLDIPDEADGAALVVTLGVNDTWNHKKYVKYLNDMAIAWKNMGYKLYFASVNPVGSGAAITQEDIDRFNACMKEELSDDWTYIDTATDLKKEGFSSTDGLHYGKNTYRRIFNLIMDRVPNTTHS